VKNWFQSLRFQMQLVPLHLGQRRVRLNQNFDRQREEIKELDKAVDNMHKAGAPVLQVESSRDP
jgi:hypothetical protein